MLVYIAVALFPFLIYKINFEWRNKNREKLIKIILSILPMFILIAFRHEMIGADTYGYLREFRDMIEKPWSLIFYQTREEYVFRVFVKLMTYVTHSPLFYQVICTVLYFIGFVSFLYHLDFDAAWPLFFFATTGIYTFMFTATRQCIAMSICLFSYQFLKRKKLIRFLICVVFAFLFHRSAILFLFAYLIFRRKLSPLNVILYSGITIGSLLLLEQIQNWFGQLMNANYEVEDAGNGWVFFIFLTLLTVFAIVIVYTNGKRTAEVDGLINVSVISVALWVLRLFTRQAERPSFYFLFFSVALFGYAVDAIDDDRDRGIIKLVAFALCMALYIYRFFTNFASFVPYQFYGLEPLTLSLFGS